MTTETKKYSPYGCQGPCPMTPPATTTGLIIITQCPFFSTASRHHAGQRCPSPYAQGLVNGWPIILVAALINSDGEDLAPGASLVLRWSRRWGVA